MPSTGETPSRLVNHFTSLAFGNQDMLSKDGVKDNDKRNSRLVKGTSSLDSHSKLER